MVAEEHRLLAEKAWGLCSENLAETGMKGDLKKGVLVRMLHAQAWVTYYIWFYAVVLRVIVVTCVQVISFLLE